MVSMSSMVDFSDVLFLVKFTAPIERLLNTYYTLLWIAFNQNQSKLQFHSSLCVSVNLSYAAVLFEFFSIFTELTDSLND